MFSGIIVPPECVTEVFSFVMWTLTVKTVWGKPPSYLLKKIIQNQSTYCTRETLAKLQTVGFSSPFHWMFELKWTVNMCNSFFWDMKSDPVYCYTICFLTYLPLWLFVFSFLFKTGKKDAKQTTNISVERAEKMAETFIVYLWGSLSLRSMLSLRMCLKGKSAQERRWTLMSHHTSGGIFFPISICCRLLSTLLLLVR